MNLNEFIKKHNIDKVRHLTDWNGYNCFVEDFGDNCPEIGMPEVIMAKGSSVKFANDNELDEIFATIPD